MDMRWTSSGYLRTSLVTAQVYLDVSVYFSGLLTQLRSNIVQEQPKKKEGEILDKANQCSEKHTLKEVSFSLDQTTQLFMCTSQES